MRQYVVFFFCILALFGSAATIGVTTTARDYDLRGYADATTDTNLPYRIPRFGVNADLTQYSAGELSSQLDLMQAAGVYWVRQIVRWDEIEPTRDDYNWQKIDPIMEVFRDRLDMELVVVLFGAPAWASDSDQRTAPPHDPADFATFAGQFAARYGDVVHTYQVWDEPNLDDAWGDSEPRVAEYAALLNAAYAAIYANDSSATVLAAALAPTTESSGRNISDWQYLEQLYQFGVSDYADGFAAKPYGFEQPPLDRTVSESALNFSRIVRLREIMVEHGDGHKPLWASEFGWNSLPDGWQGEASIWGDVSSDEQIAYTTQAIDRAEREWPWLGGLVLANWQPNTETDSARWGFSLLDSDDQPTALYESLLGYEWPNAATNGLYHPVTPYAQYSGIWTFGELGADIGWLETSDSQLTFSFIGRSLAMLVRKDNYPAFLYATVDGQPAGALPQDNQENGYIFLRSASKTPETVLVPVVNDLSETQHVLEAVADRGWDRWALAGYAVSDGDLREPYDNQIAVATLTFVIALIATAFNLIRLPWRKLGTRVTSAVPVLSGLQEFVLAVLASLFLMIGLMLTWNEQGPNIFRREAAQTVIAVALSAGLIAFQPGVILSFVSLLVLFVIVTKNTQVSIRLIILYAPFFLFPLELYRFFFQMAEIMVWLTFAGWLIQRGVTWARDWQIVAASYRQRVQINLSALDWGLVAWVIIAAISILWADYRGEAVRDFRELFLQPFLFYVLLRTSKRTPDLTNKWVLTFIAAGTIVAVASLLTRSIITAEDGAMRLAGIYGSPNNLALYLLRCIPFALSGALFLRDRNLRLFLGAASLLMIVVVLLTQSVSAYLISLPVIVVILLLARFGRRALLPIVAFALLAGVAGVILMQVSPRFASLLDWSQGTNFLRLRVWESAVDMIKSRPITGFGLDQFLYAFRSHYIRPDAIWDPDLSHPHNVIFDVWLRLGIGGLLIFLWMMVHYWKNAIITNWNIQWIRVGMIGSMAALLAHGMVDNSIFVIDLAYVFVMLLAMVQMLSPPHPVDAPEK